MNLPTLFTFLHILLLYDLITKTAGEYFTSSKHLQELLHKEMQLRDHLKMYIERNEHKIERLKSFYALVNQYEEKITEDNVPEYAGNPLFIYGTIRRLTKDWMRVKEAANQRDKFQVELDNEKEYFPKEDDVDGAKSAIIRLQETFSLSTRSILDGLEQNHQGTPKLDIKDAFQFGYHAYRTNYPEQSKTWMQEVLQLLDISDHSSLDFSPSKARFQALDLLSWAEYQLGNVRRAYNVTVELLKLEPNHQRLSNNLRHMTEEIEKLNHVEEKEEEKVKNPEPVKHGPFYYDDAVEDDTNRYYVERERANALCRGETKPIPRNYRKYLLCWYKSDHPILVLKPAKLERLYPRPEIIMFRDAIPDWQMRRIKRTANPMLQRATVHNPATGKVEPASYRVSKSAWLNREDDYVVWKGMNDRIEAYTGLDMEHTEELQVANYGIGGFYEPHFDFGRIVPIRPPPWKKRDNYTRLWVTKHHKKNLNQGERIATFLYYLSDVESGGATVFTNIGQAVRPRKGDAVFWYNLMHDGTGDYLTRHAACPVLIGDKWVCNRWIHEYGQEFRRRCEMEHERDWRMTPDGTVVTK